MSEPEFLTLAEVLDIHRRLIERHGGSPRLRDAGLLESALSVPQASFDGRLLNADLFEMAAAYAYHIAENQPFVDGNKRVALGAALVFLDMNGVEIDDPEGRLYGAMMRLSTGKSAKARLAALLRGLSHG